MITSPLRKSGPLLIMLFFLSISCSEDDERKEVTPFEPIDMSLTGVSQKGPFIIGSSVTIQELNESFSPNGSSFQFSTTDNLGSFTITSEISTPFVEVICTGFYYNEVSGEVTNSNLTVRSISPVEENVSSNINILTTLSKKRIVHLINNEDLSYSDAKIQAENEVLMLFNTSLEEVAGFEEMDITEAGEANAALLAVSIALQGKNNIADLSTLIASIIEDIETDGILDNSDLKEEIINNAKEVSMPEVRENLVARYQDLNLTIEVPDFENFLSNLYENIPPEITILNPTDGATLSQGKEITIEVTSSDEDGEIKKVNIFLNDTLVSEENSFSWTLLDLSSPQSIRAIAYDDDNGSTIDSIGFFVKENEIPAISITSPLEESIITSGEEIDITAEYEDIDGFVEKVNFYVQNELIEEFSQESGETSSTGITWKSSGENIEIVVEAIDNFGAKNSDTLKLTLVPNQLPTIQFNSPLDMGEIEYGPGFMFSAQAEDPDGLIVSAEFYLDNELVQFFNYSTPESFKNLDAMMDVSSTNSVQEFRIEVTDNLGAVSVSSIQLNLKPGVVWEEILLLSSFEIGQVGSDDTYFYLRSPTKIYRTSDGASPELILNFDNNFYNHLVEKEFDDKIWAIEWDLDNSTTKVWNSDDQGDTWNSFSTNYIEISQTFTFNNKLYAVNDLNHHIYELDGSTWVLVAGASEVPWESDNDLDNVKVIEFDGKMIVLENNLLTLDRKVWTSSDFINWTESTITISFDHLATNYLATTTNEVWAFSAGNDIFRSNDGVSWENMSTNDSQSFDYIGVTNKSGIVYLFSSTGEGALYKLVSFGF